MHNEVLCQHNCCPSSSFFFFFCLSLTLSLSLMPPLSCLFPGPEGLSTGWDSRCTKQVCVGCVSGGSVTQDPHNHNNTNPSTTP